MIDSIIAQAYQENTIQGALLGLLLDGGRLISTGELSEGLLNLVPELFFFEKYSPQDFAFFRNLGPRDMLFVENLTVDELFHLAQVTSAQVALITEKMSDPTLSDYQFQEKDLRSALLSLGPLWKKIKSAQENFHLEGSRENKALFLDRDGVVIEDVPYIQKPDLVQIRSDVALTIRKAREMGFKVFVITNQSGIGRGLFSWKDYESVSDRMLDLLAKEGVYIDRVLKAPFYEKSSLASGLVRKGLRKPRPGMIHLVVDEFRIDLSQSILVGDSASDLMAGALAGISKVYLLQSSRYPKEIEKWRQWPLISRTKIGIKPPTITKLAEVFQDAQV